MEDKRPPQRLELKKHVAVVHSSNRLTLLQRKIANALLFNAYADLMVKDEHEIHIGSLCRLIGYNSNDHKTIKKALVNLLSTVLEWNLVDGDRLDAEGIWNASSILADASIDGSVCTYSYSNKMRQLLFRPDIYAKIDMVIQARFQSSYGLALYENCNRYRAIGKTPWFAVEQFRLLMGVEGRKYSIFRDFKTRVIDKAIEEVNACSPIMVRFLFKKEKRKVTSIRFEITDQPQSAEKLPPPASKPETALTELKIRLKKEFGFREPDIRRALSGYGVDYVLEKCALVQESASYRAGQIRNPRQYLLAALEKNFSSGAEKPLVEKPAHSAVNAAMIDNAVDRLRKNDLIDGYHRAQNNHILQKTRNLTPKQYQQLEAEFSSYMLKEARGVYQNIYLKEGMKNPLIEDQFCLFIRRSRPELLAGFLSLEAWGAQVGEVEEEVVAV